ncbi:hypothetical protein C483_00155 [Natrialba hulunbeirensis JCM 10989]|uniref:Uncharacterized protein n=1 Tax=Natrialba hulunbeirensis JCM 10989 TaxID=1227493 RepID=M0ACR9_9EURY|nr:hypothetical protein [Natrialba hulunbeirensis]ELY96191.1 hypothetical protein C483_00155 [Natrialba hulunbeirensis JCM 10989]
MSEGPKSVKEEILDRFEQKIEKNEDIPEEIVALLKSDYDNDSFGKDEEVREVIEQIIVESSESES